MARLINIGFGNVVNSQKIVAVVSPDYLPESTTAALENTLAAYGEDLNGDGKVVVKVNVFTD